MKAGGCYAQQGRARLGTQEVCSSLHAAVPAVLCSAVRVASAPVDWHVCSLKCILCRRLYAPVEVYVSPGPWG